MPVPPCILACHHPSPAPWSVISSTSCKLKASSLGDAGAKGNCARAVRGWGVYAGGEGGGGGRPVVG
jgi:hypothetical protein